MLLGVTTYFGGSPIFIPVRNIFRYVVLPPKSYEILELIHGTIKYKNINSVLSHSGYSRRSKPVKGRGGSSSGQREKMNFDASPTRPQPNWQGGRHCIHPPLAVPSLSLTDRR